MNSNFSEYYRKYENDKTYVLPEHQVKVNGACVTLIDGSYCRVYIVQINAFSPRISVSKLLVHCVDYGFSRNVDYHKGSIVLKCLDKKFSSFPTEIYECHLANILMMEDSQKIKDAAAFVEAFCMNQELIVTATEITPETVEVILRSEKIRIQRSMKFWSTSIWPHENTFPAM